MDETVERKEAQRVPPGALALGGVYQLHSRNLAFGVYAGDGEFIGIRTKFAKRFVDGKKGSPMLPGGLHHGRQRTSRMSSSLGVPR